MKRRTLLRRRDGITQHYRVGRTKHRAAERVRKCRVCGTEKLVVCSDAEARLPWTCRVCREGTHKRHKSEIGRTLRFRTRGMKRRDERIENAYWDLSEMARELIDKYDDLTDKGEKLGNEVDEWINDYEEFLKLIDSTRGTTNYPLSMVQKLKEYGKTLSSAKESYEKVRIPYID